MKNIIDFVVRNKDTLLKWQLLIFYYLVIRVIFGLEYMLMYALVAVFFILRIPLPICVLAFFILSMIAYVSGNMIEANHYMSFVYGFVFIILVIHLFSIVKKRFLKK